MKDGIAIKGAVKDSLTNKGCVFSIVMLLAEDSSLIKYTRPGKDGVFILRGVSPGKYFLLVTHPSYTEYMVPLNIPQGDSLVELPTCRLGPRSQSLEAVIVSADMRPAIKGDTLEFNTAHIKTRVNATIEELLKRLPGVYVDPEGNIYVNGEKIDRLLVDGETMFGGNPTIVTRNLNADMIGKVQVLDKKSAQSEFTGVDDGTRTKTLNLTLKDDSKHGFFANGDIGAGTRGVYSGNMMLGSFNGSRQMAVWGNLNNTGVSESIGNGAGGSGASQILIDAMGASAGKGIPREIGGGIQYSNRWDEDHFNGSYQYGNLTSQPYSLSVTREILPDSVYVQMNDSRSDNFQVLHVANIDYDYVADSLNRFRFGVGGMDGRGSNNLSDSGNASFNDTLVNSSRRHIYSALINQNFSSSIMWSLLGRRNKSRNLSVSMGLTKQDNSTKGFLYARNDFYQRNGALIQADTTDQRKSIIAKATNMNGSISYTSSIWRNVNIGVSYGVNINRGSSMFLTYNRGDGKYDQFIDTLSSNYLEKVSIQKLTLNIQTKSRLFTYLLAGDVSWTAYRQKDELRDADLKYNYINVAPRVSIRYTFGKYTRLNFNYSGSSIQPSIQQMQPVKNNTDPLHITIGNPELRPSFSNTFILDYNSYKSITLNLGGTFGFTTSSISIKTITDSIGRQVSQAVNTDGDKKLGVRIGGSVKLKKLKVDVGVKSYGSVNQTVNYVNSSLNRSDSYLAGGGIQVKRYSDLYSLSINSIFNYTYSRSSINRNAITQYWTRYVEWEMTLFCIKNWELGANLVYKWRQKLDAQDNRNSSELLNAFVKRNYFSNRLTMRLQVNDILSQNAGITRNVIANITTDNTYNVIGRYLMLAVSYRFVRHN